MLFLVASFTSGGYRPSFGRCGRVAFALLSAMLVGAYAWAAPFASLVVTPLGAQQYDITSGITTLPDGGTIVDQQTGVVLSAQRIEYLAGSYVSAWSVEVAGAFGKVKAETLHIDLAAGALTANGGLTLTRDGLVVSAGDLAYFASEQIAVFGGGVVGTDPKFSADRVLLDVLSGDVLLAGEYRFEGGFFAMQSPEGGGQLALIMVLADGVPTYDAATEATPELLARLQPFL